jgi:hypothetical protein
MVINESLDVPHNVCIALVSRCGHFGQALVFSLIVCGSWLSVEDERYGEETLGRE